MVSVPLFFSHFSTGIRFAVRRYHGFGYAIYHPVDGVKSGLDCNPLLYHDYKPVSEFRGHRTKVLLRKNMTPSFEDIEHKETYVPYPDKEEGIQNAEEFYRAYIMSYFKPRS
jgi:hypothetical protein